MRAKVEVRTGASEEGLDEGGGFGMQIGVGQSEPERWTCSYAGCASNVPAGMPTTRGASSSEIVYAAPTASSIAVTSMNHVLG